jgi:cobaltochelatase CobN
LSDVPQRNMVQRLDGRMVNAGRKRGMLMVCVHGCCCGLTERGFAPVPTDLYHNEWERRKLRNKVHLNQGGCLGPCPLANVAMLVLDGRPYWFHSLNEKRLIVALYDYIESLLAAGAHVVAPALLAPHVFNGFAWDGEPAAVDKGRSTAGDMASAPSVIGDGIVVLTQADTDLLMVEQARALLPMEFAALRAAHIGRQEDDAAQLALLDELLPGVAVVVARLHSARSFDVGLDRLQRWADSSDGFLMCLPAVEALDPDLMARSTVGVPLAHLVSAYFQCGGAANVANALLCLSDHLLLSGWGYDPPQELPAHGIYRKEKRGEQPADLPSFDDELPASVTIDPFSIGVHSKQVSSLLTSRPTVGLLFYRAHLLSGNTAFVDALTDELHAQGMQARAVYTQSLKEGAAGELPDALKVLTADGPVDAIVNTLSFAIGHGEPHPFTLIDAPVVQAITVGGDRDTWQRGGRGLGPLDTAMNVAIPEFDGRIIGVPISFKAQPADGGGARYVPDTERVRRVAGLARRQIALRHIPNANKRIAVVFTNSSAKAQRVGNAVGLDAPASLVRLLEAMRAEGYTIGALPANSDQILLDLIDRCSYDQTWLTDAQLARARRLPIDQYAGWFAELPASRQNEMVKQWGAAPGRVYVHNGAFALAGLEFGNVFVALQSPRGYDMDPNAIYHRPDLPPPHNYYALYRWLREVWQADAIVHMGKHGTLEWLPGKGVGLGAECYPDLFLDDLPLIYPFIINDPGEGNQAKRRSHAVIVDHMTPPMTSAGAYGALAELAQLVDEYYQMEQLDQARSAAAAAADLGCDTEKPAGRRSAIYSQSRPRRPFPRLGWRVS